MDAMLHSCVREPREVQGMTIGETSTENEVADLLLAVLCKTVDRTQGLGRDLPGGGGEGRGQGV